MTRRSRLKRKLKKTDLTHARQIEYLKQIRDEQLTLRAVSFKFRIVLLLQRACSKIPASSLNESLTGLPCMLLELADFSMTSGKSSSRRP